MKHLLVFMFVLTFGIGFAQEKPLPIIDIHQHAYDSVQPGIQASWTAEKEAQALTSAASAEAHLRATLAEMEANNIVLALTSGKSLAVIKRWKQAAPNKFLGGIQTDDAGKPLVSADSLKRLVETGTLDVLGELGLQYYGIRPDDPKLEPYYAVAEEMGIPVCLHTGLGPPGAPHTTAPKFRTTLGRPSLFEPVLIRHPDLKAFLAHAGWPYMEETIAMMYIYPNLYEIGRAWCRERVYCEV